jgi:hypothetical protein
MTILSLGWGVSRFTCCGYHRIVIPTGAKRSGGTCCFSRGQDAFLVLMWESGNCPDRFPEV